MRKAIYLAIGIVLVTTGFFVFRNEASEERDKSVRETYAPHARPMIESAEAPNEIPNRTPKVTKETNSAGFRVAKLSQPEVLAGPLAETIEQRADSARKGNAADAYSLHLDLYECMQLLHDHSLSSSITEISEPKHRESYAEYVESKLAMCGGLSDEQLASAADWLLLAAELGDLNAQILYASRAPTLTDLAKTLADPNGFLKERNNAIRFMEAAARQCSPEAISSLYMWNEQGTMGNQNLQLVREYQIVLQTISGDDPITVSQGELSAGAEAFAQQRAADFGPVI